MEILKNKCNNVFKYSNSMLRAEINFEHIINSIKMWKNSHIINETIVDKIYTAIMKNENIDYSFHYGIVNNSQSDLLCIDGNHRRIALTKACTINPLLVYTKIYITIYLFNSYNEVIDQFERLNTRTTINLTQALITDEIKQKISFKRYIFRNNYNRLYVQSLSPRSPNYNDNMVQSLIERIYLLYKGQISVDHIMIILDRVNNELIRTLTHNELYSNSVTDKCIVNKMFLFIDKPEKLKLFELFDICRNKINNI